MNMQDEVHRFAITSHINKRRKSLTSSVLDEIKGLGSKRQAILLSAFGSVEEIKKASREELSQYVPDIISILIKEKLNNNSK